jgi:hypothetical protein
MISWLVSEFRADKSAAGAADELLASDNDKPATPNTGMAIRPRFRFEECFVYAMATNLPTREHSDDRLYGQCNREQGHWYKVVSMFLRVCREY